MTRTMAAILETAGPSLFLREPAVVWGNLPSTKRPEPSGYFKICLTGLVNISHLSDLGSNLQLAKTVQFASSILGLSARK